ncbi:hypothetical protein PCASD_06153 [Puccinia coronata f. sp. avenae]|uniref:Uncharacterized protein n=1 Tax=Puccinia coronata f. sp. avenae TaxID=200324 RepID=A0A2N5V007_9BASI|nr:hypothetical protein PCASD_06153 [Puccinia coronata f. sp. avenae]
MKAQRDKDRLRREHNDYRARRKADLDKQKRVTSIVTAVAKRFQPEDILRPDCTNLRQWERTVCRGLIAARPKGVRTPPQTPKKKACGGCTPSHTGVQTPARPPPHAARRPHAYKWREDGRLGVRPRRTGVLAMHACLEGVQALHTLRTGVHGWHACPARLT